MRYCVHQPSPPLCDFVDYVWYLSDAPAHARERIVPSGTVELVVNLHEDEFRIYGSGDGRCRRFPGAVVSGCYGAAFGIDTREHASILGVHFKPGGAAGLLGAPPGELTDAHVDLDSLWSRAAGELREQLCAATELGQRFQILDQVLVSRLPHAPPGREVVRTALDRLEQPRVEIGAISEALGLSRRRFIEVFTEQVGMTPKRYARVRRFQRALTLALQHPAPAWAELAPASGYFDQAHLCRDWAELSGCSPSELVAMRRGAQVKDNHLALPA